MPENIVNEPSVQKTQDPIAPPIPLGSSSGNTSGQGSGAIAPDGVKGWGWGPFLLSWIWAIGNGVWIGLLALVPYVGFIMAIVLGFKGREWAWQAKKWENVEHFNRVQKNWSIAGLVLIILSFVIGFIVALAAISSGATIPDASY